MCRNESISSLPFIAKNVPITCSRIGFVDKTGDINKERNFVFKRREIIAWAIIAIQSVALMCALQGNARQLTTENPVTMGSPAGKHDLSMNGKPFSYYYDKRNLGSYDPPTVYPAEAGLVSRVWHSNGSPQIHPEAHTGSCWCSADSYCMCTPSLAIDLILTSGPDIWLVKRAKEEILALIGGFNEVGESVEDASRREMKEEIGIDLPDQPLNLIGVYSDPKRDARKHSVSVVFQMEIPPGTVPIAGDDAKEVIRLPLSDVQNIDSMWADHKTILVDFINKRESLQQEEEQPGGSESNVSGVKRSICSM
mmetsp:Transcript_14444/g.21287  ORF Transcript_14444/g.21287 Transcript_14444/m.21287 type:complete len:309 (-) Transcript_14444:29-955(-)